MIGVAVLKPCGFKESWRIRVELDKLAEDLAISYFIETDNKTKSIKYVIVHGDFNPDLQVNEIAVITNNWYIIYPRISDVLEEDAEYIEKTIECLYETEFKEEKVAKL